MYLILSMSLNCIKGDFVGLYASGRLQKAQIPSEQEVNVLVFVGAKNDLSYSKLTKVLVH